MWQKTGAILDAVKQELEFLHGKLAGVGLRWSEPNLKVWKQSEPDFTAEVQIWFYSGEEPVDFLEFFVFRDGEPVASEAELRVWIRESTSDVIRQQLSRSGRPTP